MDIHSAMIEMLPDIEETLKEIVYKGIPDQYSQLRSMMTYHLGWETIQGYENNSGKRIRPLLVLLSTSMCGGEWQKALPAAAAIELIHNFSLIHDDIEDQSEFRRGKPTIWKLYGINQAINCGDAMFSLAQLGLLNLGDKINPKVAFEAAQIMNKTCLSLTEGQYLDMKFESENFIERDEYFQMISCKTGALISAATELGAVVSQTSKNNRNALRTYGEAVGIAFQLWDDLLGIWGNETLTGKSTSSDIISGKKTLPIIYAGEKDPAFYELYSQKPQTDSEIVRILNELEKLGSKKYVQKVASYYIELADKSLATMTDINQEALQTIHQLTAMVINREK